MASSPDISQETLICVVCYENYNETDHTPMVLGNCGHSICSACLNPLTRNGKVSCPKCRVTTMSKNVKVNYDLREAAILNREQEKDGDEKVGFKKSQPSHQLPSRRVNPPTQQQESSSDMSDWLAAGAVLVGAAVFGITGYALGRRSNRPRQ